MEQESVIESKADKFVHLHAHGTWSFLDGYGTAPQIVSRVKELGQTAFALSDHGNLFGVLEMAHECSKNDIKFIPGCEFYHVADRHSRGAGKESTTEQRRKAMGYSHITILAKDLTGYRNLLKLNQIAHEEGFYYKPRIDFDAIVRNQEGLILMSGCVAGMLSRLINEKKPDLAHRWVDWLKKRVENFYIEIIPCPSLDISINACKTLWEIASDLNIERVITSDSHFPRPEDYIAEDTLVCIQTKDSMVEEVRRQMAKPGDPNPGQRKMQLPEYHYICSESEIRERTQACLPHVPLAEIDEAIANTRRIADSIDIELPKSKGPIYPVNVELGQTDRSLLLEWIEKGREYRRSLGLLPPEGSPEMEVYVARQKREMEIIDFHGFHNYFLLVSDLVRWSNDQRHMCIARGSAAGSLICWYLGITQVDPIRFELPVERFIDETRPDLPDIDLDFDSRYRDEAFHYLAEKYGRDNCGKIAALSYYRGRAAIRDVAQAFNIPSNVTNRLCALIPPILDADEGMKSDTVLVRMFAESPEIQEIVRQYPQFSLAVALEGQIRQSTIHAAGFIVDREPIRNTAGVISRPGQLPIVMADKDYAAKQGLLKIDALSVSTLSVIAECLEALDKDFNWLYSLPLDDEPTFRMVSTGRSTGVFQLQGGACSRMLQQLKPTNIDEFIAVSALARPGPLQSGGAQEYLDVKYGRAQMPNYHPAIRKILDKTNGIVLYQEQVMSVARELGNVPWKDVHKIRKTITSRAGANAIDKYYPEYEKYAREELKIPSEQAEHVWNMAKKAGNYVFNKAHVTMYGIIGYWTAYLKTHFPATFTAIACKYEDHDIRRTRLLRDFSETGGDFRLIDPNLSRQDFRAIDATTLVGGFRNLAGVGGVYAQRLVDGQPYSGWEHFYEVCPKRVREGLQATGIHEGRIDATAAIAIAPWYVKPEFTELEEALFESHGVTPCGYVNDYRDEGKILFNVVLGGKITSLVQIDLAKEAKKYGRPMPGENDPKVRAVLLISDKTGTQEVSFSAWKWRKILATRNPLRGSKKGLGCGAIIKGVISEDGSRIFGDDIMILPTPEEMAMILQRDRIQNGQMEGTFQLSPSTALREVAPPPPLLT